MGISSQTKTWNLVHNLHFTEKCAGLLGHYPGNGTEGDEVQKFLTFNFTIFGVDSLRAGVQRSLEPVQLLQLSAKCGEW